MYKYHEVDYFIWPHLSYKVVYGKVSYMITTILFFVLLVSTNSMLLTNEENKFLQSILELIPKEERKSFLIQQLYLGYAKTKPPGIEVNESVTLKIFKILMKMSFQSSSTVGTPICFPDGTCVDPGDSGIYPV